jgi:cytochrome c oxidase assembly factor CtaG
MAEHEVLMVAVAPLLILAHPMGVFAWGLPASGRHELAALAGSRVLRVLTRPSVAWALQAAALWLWHMPRLFEAALASPALHILQHACFLISALLFWWSLFHGGAGAMRHGAALLSLFTTVIHTSLLGALLTVSPIVWYASLAADPSSGLADQQLAGIIMWVPGGILYVAEALWVAADWMRVSEARTRNWERSAALSRHVG